MIDLHTHVLHDVDDGAESLEEAVEMCRLAAEDGVRALVATPHQRHPMWLNDDRERLEERLAAIADAAGETIELHLGAEIRIDGQLYRELERDDRRLLTLAGSRYLLLEFARQGPPFGMQPETVVHEVELMGFVPVLAHPELIPWLGEDDDLLLELEEAGALVQITAMSLTGQFGRAPLKNALRLMYQDRVHFVASDCHGVATRPPGLRAAREIITPRWGEERAARLLEHNPRAVLDDRPLEGQARTPAFQLPGEEPLGPDLDDDKVTSIDAVGRADDRLSS